METIRIIGIIIGYIGDYIGIMEKKMETIGIIEIIIGYNIGVRIPSLMAAHHARA